MSPHTPAIITAVCILASIAAGLRAVHTVGSDPDHLAATDAGVYTIIATAAAFVLELPLLTLVLGLTSVWFTVRAGVLTRRKRAATGRD